MDNVFVFNLCFFKEKGMKEIDPWPLVKQGGYQNAKSRISNGNDNCLNVESTSMCDRLADCSVGADEASYFIYHAVCNGYPLKNMKCLWLEMFHLSHTFSHSVGRMPGKDPLIFDTKKIDMNSWNHPTTWCYNWILTLSNHANMVSYF